jgi:uncharacterized protein YxjI
MTQPAGANPYAHSNYQIKKAFFNFLNRKFRIYDPMGQLVLYCEMKAFKLKEDIRVYSDEAKTQEVMVMKARQILDISPTFDIWDSVSQQKIGALKRAGLKSIIRDEWSILDVNDNEYGKIQEDSQLLALVRRFLSNLIPQSYSVAIQGQEIIQFKQNFNPFLLKLNLNFQGDPNFALDRRIGIAAAILLCAIEGRQQ